MIVAAIYFAILVVVWAVGIALVLSGSCFAAVIGGVFALLLPVIFAVFAFLRLFVLLPSLWKHITNLTIAFAAFAGNEFLFSSCFAATDEGTVFFTSQKAKAIRYKTFHILDDSNKKAREKTKINTLKKSAVNYLLLEFAFESVPQMSVQVLNNRIREQWSAIGIASLIVSVYAIASTLYKYGYEKFCLARFDQNNKKIEKSSTAKTGKKTVNPVYTD